MEPLEPPVAAETPPQPLPAPGTMSDPKTRPPAATVREDRLSAIPASTELEMPARRSALLLVKMLGGGVVDTGYLGQRGTGAGGVEAGASGQTSQLPSETRGQGCWGQVGGKGVHRRE